MSTPEIIALEQKLEDARARYRQKLETELEGVLKRIGEIANAPTATTAPRRGRPPEDERYLSALREGPATITQLSKKLGIGYHYTGIKLRRMEKRGVVIRNNAWPYIWSVPKAVAK